MANANAICDESSKLINAVSSELGTDASDKEIDDFVKQTLVPAIRDEIARIRALGFPSGDANKLNGVLFDMDGVLDDLSVDPNKVLSQGSTPFEDINRRLDDYGLTACGSGTDTGGAPSSDTTTPPSTVAT